MRDREKEEKGHVRRGAVAAGAKKTSKGRERLREMNCPMPAKTKTDRQTHRK